MAVSMDTDATGPGGTQVGVEVKVWFRVNEEGRKPIPVKVKPNDDVFDAMEVALVKVKLLGIAPDKVTVKFHDEEVDTETLIKDELDRGHGNRKANHFLLELPQDDEPQAKRKRKEFAGSKQPHLPSRITPSKLTPTMVKRNGLTVAGRIYSHWFALELYNLTKTLQVTDGAPTVVTINGMHENKMITFQSLDRIVKCFQSVSKLPELKHTGCRSIVSDPILAQSEVTSTAFLARQLDRFLFSEADVDVGACLHQFPVNCSNTAQHSPENSDMFVVTLHYNLPNEALAISDFKKHEMSDAERESLGYSVRLMEKHEKNDFVTHLVFPTTRHVIKLQLHVGFNECVMPIDIHEASISNMEELRQFFCVMYAAVHGIINCPISTTTACVSPLPNLSLSNSLTHQTSLELPCRVFVENKVVYKLYDTDEDEPNLEVVKLVLPDACLQPLSVDRRFLCLKYAYQDGNHIPKSHSQFATILCQLHMIHDEGYVHSDIRDINIVFSQADGSKAWIIDFDIAGKEGSLYPHDYNHYCIEERHRFARSKLPRRKEHDRYALGVIMERFGVDKAVVKKVQYGNDNLSDIAKSLK